MSGPGFVYRFRVRLHDTDAAGVLFFAHLFRHAHDAYEAFMTDAGMDLPELLAGGGPHLPLVHAEADYLAPIRYGEVLRVRITLEKRGDSCFNLDYLFLDGDGTEKARARTAHVAMDLETRRPVPLPDPLLGALKRLSQD